MKGDFWIYNQIHLFQSVLCFSFPGVLWDIFVCDLSSWHHNSVSVGHRHPTMDQNDFGVLWVICNIKRAIIDSSKVKATGNVKISKKVHFQVKQNPVIKSIVKTPHRVKMCNAKIAKEGFRNLRPICNVKTPSEKGFCKAHLKCSVKTAEAGFCKV